MLKNQRGEIATALIIVMVVGGVLVGALGATKLNPLKLFHRDAANKKASWTKQVEKSKPVLLTDKSGKAVALGTEFERVYDTGKDEFTPAPTYGERVGAFLAGLTNVGLIALVAGILFFPGALAAWGVKKYADMRGVAKTIIAGVREAPPEAAEQVKNVIAVKQDKNQKKIVAKLKGELQ